MNARLVVMGLLLATAVGGIGYLFLSGKGETKEEGPPVAVRPRILPRTDGGAPAPAPAIAPPPKPVEEPAREKPERLAAPGDAPPPAEPPTYDPGAPPEPTLVPPEGVPPPFDPATGGSEVPIAPDPSAETEIDEFSAQLQLRPDQKARVRQVILEGEKELETALREATAPGQGGTYREPDIQELNRLGEQITKRIQARIRDVLDPDQRQRFDKMLEADLEGRDDRD